MNPRPPAKPPAPEVPDTATLLDSPPVQQAIDALTHLDLTDASIPAAAAVAGLLWATGSSKRSQIGVRLVTTAIPALSCLLMLWLVVPTSAACIGYQVVGRRRTFDLRRYALAAAAVAGLEVLGYALLSPTLPPTTTQAGLIMTVIVAAVLLTLLVVAGKADMKYRTLVPWDEVIPHERRDPNRLFSARQRAEIVRRDGPNCRIPGCTAFDGQLEVTLLTRLGLRKATRIRLEVDHLHPHSRGGRTDVANGGLLCRRHNGEKGALTLEEYLRARRRSVWAR